MTAKLQEAATEAQSELFGGAASTTNISPQLNDAESQHKSHKGIFLSKFGGTNIGFPKSTDLSFDLEDSLPDELMSDAGTGDSDEKSVSFSTLFCFPENPACAFNSQGVLALFTSEP